MENKEKKSLSQYTRVWHRYLGFFVLGMLLIWALSGITLIYRDTDFLKKEKKVTTTLSPEINMAELGSALRIRDFKVIKTEGDVIYFQGGTFNVKTGVAEQTVKELIYPLNKWTSLHKTASKSVIHWFTLIFGIIMLFLAVSSFWMFKPGSVVFRKGMITVAAGIVFTLILLLLM